jgi:hypothetical protein
MKVTGSHIKVLLEVESTATVRKKLAEWGFDAREYISTDELISKIEELNNPEPFVTYDGKAKGSEKL